MSTDGKSFASGGHDGKVVIWDLANARELFVLRSTGFEVSSLAWNPNGKQLVAGYSNGAVKLWDLPQRQQPATTVVSTEPIRSIQWSAAEHRLTFEGVTTGARSSWDVFADKTAQTIADSPAIHEAMSPNGQLMAMVASVEIDNGSKIIVKDPNSTQILCELDFPYTYGNSTWPQLVWSPNNQRLAAYIRTKMVLWEIPSGKRLFDWEGPAISKLAWAADGKRVALAGGGDRNDNGTQAYMSHIQIFDVDQKSRLLKKRTSTQRVLATSVAWNSTCERISSGNENGEVGVWDVATGAQIFKAGPPVTAVKSMDWTPDGTRLASVSTDGSLKILDASTGEDLLTLVAGKQALTAVKWSSDGTQLAAGDNAGRAYVWTAQATDVTSYSSDQRRALAEMHAARSALRKEQGDLAIAITELTKAIELAPSRTAYRRARATCYAQQGQFEQALNDLTVAFDLDPDDKYILRARVGCYANLGRWQEALADASRLVDLTQDSTSRFQLAVVHLMLGNSPAYREICRQESVGEANEFVYGAQYRAWTCSLAPGNVNEFEDLLALVREAMQPGSDPMPGSLGALLYRSGQVEDAVEALIEANRHWERSGSIEAPGSDYDLLPGYTWYFLAMASHDLGRYTESRDWYDKAEAYSQTMLINKAGSLNWHQRTVLELLQRETRLHIAADSPSSAK